MPLDKTPPSIDAPYNFVPLSPWVHTPDWGWQVSQDLPFRDGLCGHLDLTITAESPILVGRERRRSEEPSAQQAGQAHPYRLPDGRYALPGTALKGMIRNVVEIASFSRMAAVDDVRHGLRDISSTYVKDSYTAKVRDGGQSRMRTGFMRLGPDGLPEITPCAMVRLDHRALETWLGVKAPIFPADRAVAKKYATWEQTCAKARQDPKTLQFTPLAWEATDLSSGTKIGVAVLTGQVSDSQQKDKTGKQTGKHRDFVFYDERPDDAFAPSRQEWSDFLFVHGDQATRDAEGMSWPGYWKGRYWNGDAIPVFYLRDGDKTRIGLAYMPRLAGDFSVHELRDHTSPGHGQGGANPDFAETLFGKVGDRPDACLRGRVTFHHAVASERRAPQATEATILNGPKASYFPNYLRQPAGPDGRLRDGEGYATCLATAQNPKPELRGWKRYPARPEGDAKVQDLTDEQKAPNKKKVQVILHPLPKGTQFTTRLDFHNLRTEELGALCWALTWGGAQGLRHGLGMGKPFGFGQVTIAITGADLRPNLPDAPGTTWEDARDAFVDYMDRHYAEAHRGATWRTSPQIKALLGMADPAKASQFKGALKHMRLEPKKKDNEFLKAKQSALVLLSYVEGDHPRTRAEVAAEQEAAEARLRAEAAARAEAERLRLEEEATREEADRLRMIEAQAKAEREAAERAEAQRRQAEWDAKPPEQKRIIETRREVERFLAFEENQRRTQREALQGRLNALAKEAAGWSRAEDRNQAADFLDATYSDPKVGWTDPGLNKQKREKQEKKRRALIAAVRSGAAGSAEGAAGD